ncbi:hypothetical protein F4604DRAFT_1913758 [Suillus subluteus]|nr:hypothetical protein F4604DRAFT_1913758 [Suillus subluteus]
MSCGIVSVVLASSLPSFLHSNAVCHGDRRLCNVLGCSFRGGFFYTPHTTSCRLSSPLDCLLSVSSPLALPNRAIPVISTASSFPDARDPHAFAMPRYVPDLRGVHDARNPCGALREPDGAHYRRIDSEEPRGEHIHRLDSRQPRGEHLRLLGLREPRGEWTTT